MDKLEAHLVMSGFVTCCLFGGIFMEFHPRRRTVRRGWRQTCDDNMRGELPLTEEDKHDGEKQ